MGATKDPPRWKFERIKERKKKAKKRKRLRKYFKRHPRVYKPKKKYTPPEVLEYRKQRKQELREQFIKDFDFILRLAKGSIDTPAADTFYHMVLGSNYVDGPKTIEEVRIILRAAWWVEIDDLSQHLLGYIWEKQLWDLGDENFPKMIWLQAKDWLFKQRVFSRAANWESDYTHWMLDIGRCTDDPSIIDVLENEGDYSVADRYFSWLWDIQNLNHTQVSDITKVHPRQLAKHRLDLLNMEDRHHGN